MIVKLYRNLVSDKLRAFIYRVFLGDLLIIIRNPKLWMKYRWYGVFYSIITPKTEKSQAYKAWSKARFCFTPYPYLWIKEYDKQSITVCIDSENSLPFVIHHGKKLYFGRDMIDHIPAMYKGLLIEQDIRSAHRYVDSYTELTDKNGNRIWENDICDRKEPYPEIVRYHEGDWTLDYSYASKKECGYNFCNLGFYVCERKCVEVIGNVFDNPELLEGTKHE